MYIFGSYALILKPHDLKLGMKVCRTSAHSTSFSLWANITSNCWILGFFKDEDGLQYAVFAPKQMSAFLVILQSIHSMGLQYIVFPWSLLSNLQLDSTFSFLGLMSWNLAGCRNSKYPQVFFSLSSKRPQNLWYLGFLVIFRPIMYILGPCALVLQPNGLRFGTEVHWTYDHRTPSTFLS